MKTYKIIHKIKGERVWCDQCLKSLIITGKTKKEAKEKAFEILNPYNTTIVRIDII